MQTEITTFLTCVLKQARIKRVALWVSTNTYSKNIKKMYSWEYGDIQKVLVTPLHVGYGYVIVIHGHCCALVSSCTDVTTVDKRSSLSSGLALRYV
jgi:hypothetical protein